MAERDDSEKPSSEIPGSDKPASKAAAEALPSVEAPPLSSYVPGEGEILSMKSAFGDLKYVAPIAQFSETPASWATPPEPAGASAARWQ